MSLNDEWLSLLDQCPELVEEYRNDALINQYIKFGVSPLRLILALQEDRKRLLEWNIELHRNSTFLYPLNILKVNAP